MNPREVPSVSSQASHASGVFALEDPSAQVPQEYATQHMSAGSDGRAWRTSCRSPGAIGSRQRSQVNVGASVGVGMVMAPNTAAPKGAVKGYPERGRAEASTAQPAQLHKRP